MLIKLYEKNNNPKDLARIVEVLEEGGIIIYPTDTMYAIGCHALKERAIERICRLKGLDPRKNNLSIICYDLSNISEYAKVDNNTFKLMKHILPLLIGDRKAQMIIEERRSKSGSSDYNRATPMMRAILSKCVNEDLCHLMPKVTAPVLLFWGDKDTATPLHDAQTMQRLMPDAGLVVAKGAGHFAMLEQTELWMGAVKSFLKIE